MELEKKTLAKLPDLASAECLDRLDSHAYDEYLSRNVVFLDLYDSSANNALVECVVRHTPLVVTRNAATEEYLGKEYPLFFESLEEAESLIETPEKILSAHRYLRSSGMAERFSGPSFRQSMESSGIYSRLPEVF
jgi:hypothetical protein